MKNLEKEKDLGLAEGNVQTVRREEDRQRRDKQEVQMDRQEVDRQTDREARDRQEVERHKRI